MSSIADIRRDYSLKTLNEDEVAESPFLQFADWWQQAIESEIDEVNAIIKDCLDGKFGTVADEVKVAVVSFQDTPVGMCPYLALA